MDKLKSGAEKLGIHLTSRQLETFGIYYQEIVRWNQDINLTSVIEYEKVQVTHFLDSLTVIVALPRMLGDSSFRVIDVGTGAGLPGLPLRILCPEMKLVLLEATAKKASFLKHLITELKLNDVEIMVGRAEEVAHNERYREQFDVVLSRAVAKLPALVELTLPFCVVGGSFIAQKKGDIELEVNHSSKAINLLGGSMREIKAIDLEEFDDKRYLIVVDKIKNTPQKYPRRAGIPTKRPISS